MIVRSDAIVLRSIDQGETSRIVSLFTLKHGRITIIAKGARRPKSKFGSTLQPASYIQAVYYYRQQRDILTLSESNHIMRFPVMLGDIHRMSAAFRMIELVRELTEPNDRSPQLFHLLLNALVHLNGVEERAENILPHFQLHFARLLGFAPDIQREDVLALTEAGGALNLNTGTVSPSSHGRIMRATKDALRSFAIFAMTDLPTSLKTDVNRDALSETQTLIDAYLRFHVEGRYPDRAETVLRRLQDEREGRR